MYSIKKRINNLKTLRNDNDNGRSVGVVLLSLSK